MTKKAVATDLALLAVLIISIVLGCSRGNHGFVPDGDARPLTASETGIPLLVFSETNRAVYGMTTGDCFPLSSRIRESLESLLVSSTYFQVANNTKRVGVASVFTNNGMPELYIGFFEGGFVNVEKKMFLVEGDFLKIGQVLEAGYAECKKRGLENERKNETASD